MYKCTFEKFVYATKEEPTQKIRDFFSKKAWWAVFSDADGVYEDAETESCKNGITPAAIIFVTAELPFVPMVGLQVWLTKIQTIEPVIIKKVSYNQQSDSFTCTVNDERPYVSVGGDLIDMHRIFEMRLGEGWETHPNMLAGLKKLKAA